jgi:hypothetical protein
MNGTVTRDSPAPPRSDNGPDAFCGGDAALTNTQQQVFSNALAVKVDVKNKASDFGLRLRPASVQSVRAPEQYQYGMRSEGMSIDAWHTKRRDNDNLRAAGNEFSECFWECQIPAD